MTMTKGVMQKYAHDWFLLEILEICGSKSRIKSKKVITKKVKKLKVFIVWQKFVNDFVETEIVKLWNSLSKLEFAKSGNFDIFIYWGLQS